MAGAKGKKKLISMKSWLILNQTISPSNSISSRCSVLLSIVALGTARSRLKILGQRTLLVDLELVTHFLSLRSLEGFDNMGVRNHECFLP